MDVRVTIAKSLAKRLSKIVMTERAKTARAAVKERNPTKSDLSETVSDKSEKKDIRKAVVKKQNLFRVEAPHR